MLINKAGIAYLLEKDPAAVTRYELPEPDAEILGNGGKTAPVWKAKTIQQWVKTGKTHIKLTQNAQERLNKYVEAEEAGNPDKGQDDPLAPQLFLAQGERMQYLASLPHLRIED